MRTTLDEFMEDNSIVISSPRDLIQTACDIFQISVAFYENHERYIFNPEVVSSGCQLVAQIYHNGISFDSIISCALNQITHMSQNYQSRSPQPLPQLIRLCSWNLNGITSEEKRLAIDFDLYRDRVSFAGIQETHLWSERLETSHFKWFFGPQYQSRASRGLGFLIAKEFYAYVENLEFFTPNIGGITFRLPAMTKSCCYITVHKHNDGTAESSLETG